MYILQTLKNFFEKHERILSPVTLIGGFIFDYFTLDRVDFLTDNLFIIFYILLAGMSIIIINLRDAGRLTNNFIESIHEFLPFTLQFAFGGLFSAFLIFYSKSASLLTSGVFILILLFLFIGNEFFRKGYSRLTFQVGVYFAAIFSFSIYFIPVVTKRMGQATFIFSGLVSLLLISLFVLILFYLARERYEENKRQVIAVVFLVFGSINILYFTNIIPPIPLSLRSADVYHLVERTQSGNYRVLGERNSWRERLNLGQTIHLQSFEPAYVFSAVFAPTNLNVKIIHDWQYWNEAEDQWQSASSIAFPIRGGRDEGYRVYSKKGNIFPGKWRVDIKTEQGQVIGRVRFDVEAGLRELIEEVI